MPPPKAKAKAAAEAKYIQATADFVENKGQWKSQAKFLSRASGMDLWVTEKGLLLDYYARMGQARRGNVLAFDFVGANSHAKVAGENRTNFISQYLRAHRPASEAFSYKDVRVSNLYPGVDLKVYKDSGKQRYDLIVGPKADPSRIVMKIGGTKHVGIDKNGGLAIDTSIGTLQQFGLYAYQVAGGKKHQVPASFKIGKDNKVTFALGAYDHSQKLVIDPIIYGSYYGGDAGMDEVRAVVADTGGGVFMTGSTFAADFPLVLGPYITLNGNTDAFVSKFQGDAYVHNFASYIGGSGDETGKYIALDPSGNHIWVAGTTSSNNLPLVNGSSFKQTLSGATDIFLMEWTKDVNQVLVPTYATYFGSAVPANGEELKGFGVGSTSGDLYIAGVTSGPGMPNAVDAYPGAPTNAYITKLNSAGTSALWTRYVEGTAAQTLGISTLLGLPAIEGGTNPGTTNTEGNLTAKMEPNALALDAGENAFIVGTVNFMGNEDTSTAANPHFKTTSGVYLNTGTGQNGRLLRNNDIFVEKVGADGSLVYGALVGGADDDSGVAVATDINGNAYVTGVSGSFDFPRTPGTFGEVFTQQQNVTITKLNADASQIVYSTNLRTHKSPSGALYPVGISVDSRGFVFVTGMIIDGATWPILPGDPDTPTGQTGSPGAVPTTADAIRPTYVYPTTPDVPSWDSWLVVLDNTATSEIYGTYIGGLCDDGIFAPYNDRFGDVWVTGYSDTTRSYATINSTQTAATDQTKSGTLAGFITSLAFKPTGEAPNPFFMQLVTTPYGALDETGAGGGRVGFWATPNPPPFGSGGNLGNFISTGRSRDGYVMRFRLQIPIVQDLTLNPTTVPGGLGSTSTGTITLNTPATGAGVDVTVTLNNVAGASFDPGNPVDSMIVNIPAGQTTGTFTLYSEPVTDLTQVDVKAEYLDNFKVARLTVVPWLQKFSLVPTTTVGGNSVTGSITLGAPAPTGGVPITLASSDDSFISFPGGTTITVPAGQTFMNFQINTKGVDLESTYTVTAACLGVSITNPVTLEPANLLSVSFNPNRVAGGTASTGTVRLDGLPGPSGFTVNVSVNGNPAGYSVTPSTLTFGPTDSALTFTVNTAVESANTSRTITAERPAQGTYTDEIKTGTLLVDANNLLSLSLAPSTVDAGSPSTGTVTIATAGETGGVVVNLSSDNTAVATVPTNVVVSAGSTSASFTVTTFAPAVDTVVNIHATRGSVDISKPLMVKGVTFSLSAQPTSVIGGAQNITGKVTLALAAPVGGVTVNLSSSNPAAASVDPSVVVPAGQTTANFTITTSAVAATQNVTITGQTQPSTTATVTVQIRAISLSSMVLNPTYVKGGTVTHLQVFLDAPAPAGGATIAIASSNAAILNPGPITVPAGSTQSAVITLPVGRVNRTLGVTLTGTYNGKQVSATLLVHR